MASPGLPLDTVRVLASGVRALTPELYTHLPSTWSYPEPGEQVAEIPPEPLLVAGGGPILSFPLPFQHCITSSCLSLSPCHPLGPDSGCSQAHFTQFWAGPTWPTVC